MANNGGISGTAILAVLAGSAFVYSGVTGKKFSAVARDFLSGKNPSGTPADPNLGIAGATLNANTTAVNPAGDAYSAQVPAQAGTQPIVAFLKKQGFSRAQAAGILGNIQTETAGTFDPGIINQAEQAIGYCQWEGGRRTALQAYASAHGTVESDGNAQLGYMMLELNTTFLPVQTAIRALQDPGQVAAVWDATYERSSGQARQERINNAQNIYNQLVAY